MCSTFMEHRGFTTTAQRRHGTCLTLGQRVGTLLQPTCFREAREPGKRKCSESVSHITKEGSMLKSLRSSKGFTLIELMIVVAIIGILAAIAIPNFLTYQLKSRQSEAKTNLQAIRTSMLSFQAEKGCYVAVPNWPANAPTTTAKSSPTPWSTATTPAASGTSTYCLATGGVFNVPATAAFTDIGFVATGSVYYNYTTLPVASGGTVPVAACGGTGMNGNSAITGGTGGALTDLGFHIVAQSNLDGDPNISIWGASNDNGASDCKLGMY